MDENKKGKRLYINNQWIFGHGPILTSYNPANGEIVWQGPTADSQDINAAIQAARSAFPQWANRPLEERISFLQSFKEILSTQKLKLAETISLENGKPFWDSKNEVEAIISKIDISIQAYAVRCAKMVHTTQERQMVATHRPHGVIAIFGPFNFPAHLPSGHLIPALLAGNTIIFKPSELTPLVAETLFQLWEKANLPEGVLNLLQGGHETGRQLAENPSLDGLFFTGSWNTGKLLSQLFSQRAGKILALEMGGNNPLIVTQGVDLKASAYMTIQSAYLTSGQRCTCARRLIVPSGPSGDAFIGELCTMIKRIKVGFCTDKPEPFMGPVISPEAAAKLLETQKNWLSQGGKALVEMDLIPKSATLLSPGLIDVTAIKNRSDEEHFGPLLQLIRVENFEQALAEASKTEYGLVGGLISANKDEVEALKKSLKAGIICWNSPTTNASSALPFGGTGKSGNFRPTAYYAADYCAFPTTFVSGNSLELPQLLLPGIR